MRNILVAAVLALPFALLVTPKALAGNCCPPTPVYKFGISIGLCFKPWCGSDCVGCNKGPCPPPCGKGCGFGGCGAGPGGCGYGPIPAGPWYSYYPYNAHFQSPAPTGYPYWPAQQTSSPTPMFGGNYQMPSQAAPYSYPYSQVQPCSYYQVPSYWYGR